MSIVFRALRAGAGICATVFTVLLVAPFSASGQDDHDADHDDDHHHAPLHFAHPLFTESPSPDTKLRLNYLHADLAHGLSDHTFGIEAEYAFTRSVSIEANLPLTSRLENRVRATAVGSGEIALKLASFAAAKHGFLLGGGLAFGVPTGSDEKGIGSGHLVEVEPYLDLGYMRGALELVSFAAFSTTIRREAGEEKEQEAALAVSLLYHLGPRFESLVEMETRRALAGEESGHQVVNAGVGLKYRFQRYQSLVLGVGARMPLTDHHEFRSEIIASALYHF